MLTSQLMPTLYTSSFDADAALREPPPSTADKVIVGFREQTAAVAAVGITALLERVAVEGTSTVIEGAHVVPGFYDATPYADRSWRCPSWSRSRTRRRTGRTSRRGRTPPAVRAVPGLVRQHQEGAAVHQEPGALARRAGRPELRAGPDPGRDHRPGDGQRVRAARRVCRAGARAVHHPNNARSRRSQQMKLFLDTANLDQIRQARELGCAVRVHDQPVAARQGARRLGAADEGSLQRGPRARFARDHRDRGRRDVRAGPEARERRGQRRGRRCR